MFTYLDYIGIYYQLRDIAIHKYVNRYVLSVYVKNTYLYISLPHALGKGERDFCSFLYIHSLKCKFITSPLATFQSKLTPC